FTVMIWYSLNRTGADSVSSVGSVTAQRGGSVTIPCSYEDSYKTHVKYWCRENYFLDPCTAIVRSDSPQKKDEVSIRNDPDQSVFTVTMNNLTAGNSGYYWCGVEISRGLAVGTWIYVSVTDGKMSTVANEMHTLPLRETSHNTGLMTSSDTDPALYQIHECLICMLHLGAVQRPQDSHISSFWYICII
uniref:Ig-like domain-containing protein n=1 Tax=Paramormyrops kingsleyae TaxID=1676925 RepID=A0A3B3QQR1_9TELE